MIDLTTIDQDTIIARGQYSTVRGAHEDSKQKLAVLCGQFASITPQVLRMMQPDGDKMPDMNAVNDALSFGRNLLNKIDECVHEVEALAAQRAMLKDAAWGKGQ